MGASHSYERQQFYGDKPPFSLVDENTADKHPGVGPIIYHKQCQQKDGSFKLQKSPEFGEKSIMEVVVNSSKRFAGQRVVGFRKLVKLHKLEENGRKVEKMELENKYTWMKWESYMK